MTGTTINITDVFIDVHPLLQRIITQRTGTHHAAQDLTQDIYFRTLRLANTFPTYDDARNYLVSIAQNAATDYLRKETRQRQLLEGALYLFEDYSHTLEESHQINQQISHIDDALKQLPKKCRDVLYLSRAIGMTHAEIAQHLGVSRSLVEKYAIKAVMHCREYLKSSTKE